ncbi:MAG TPA: carboxy-S-adenosyl-L-methionine synthase CmoA [Chitinophagaceae bacterium]|nr:carboxy-S-adenosyl-L-methionine synthase CmoA [Chitinophagaceae bacterium]
MNSRKDEVFKESITKASDFKFSSKVANVFDDMVTRSVPFYIEIQRMIGEVAAHHYQEDTNVYDLGCATGTTMIVLNETIPEDIRFVGIDDSGAMLDKCNSKLLEAGINRPLSLEVADLNGQVEICNASVVVLCLTLQFVRPINRQGLVRQIFSGLVPGGALIVIEKILAEDSSWNRDFIKYYYDLKRRNNYTEMEIAQKREALENVLIPYKLSENITLLREAGFSNYEVFFKWYNFAGFIAKKNA